MACSDPAATLVTVTPSRPDDRLPAPFATVVVGSPSGPDAADGRRQASEVLEQAVGPDLADDRFEPFDHSDDGSVLLLAHHRDRPVAYVAAGSSRGRFQLDVAADVAAVGAGSYESGADTAYHEHATGLLMASMIEQATAAFDQQSVTPSSELTFELWGRPRRPWHDRLAEHLGLAEHRSLLQMRCPLPLPPPDSPVADRTRPVDAEVDVPNLVAVNNRAFAYHPDQSDQQEADVAEAFAAPSFRPDSVRILDAERDDHRAVDHPMVGFCWTKIHPPRSGREALGEIYVIAVDPAYHGEGHGTGLTAAGLRWLAEQGPTTGMLYVESDNDAAVATYRKLGFTSHATYTAWRRP